MFIIVLLGVLLVLICYWIEKCSNYWKNLGFPSVECSFPFGSLKGVGSEIAMTDAMDGFYKKYKSSGPFVGFYQFLKPLLLVTDPDMLRQIMVTDFDYFHDRYLFHNAKDDPISAHLLSMEGENVLKETSKTHLLILNWFSFGQAKLGKTDEQS
jgi:cytochrome P450 family 6